jgi:hydroxymethylglutaryl-CoA synthase
LELPISVGTVGGVIGKNPLYKNTLQILGKPSAKELAEIMVTIGLAQNFAALRALAIEGISKGHMALHARTVAQKAGVPKHLIEEACMFMALKKKYDTPTAEDFMHFHAKPKL